MLHRLDRPSALFLAVAMQVALLLLLLSVADSSPTTVRTDERRVSLVFFERPAAPPPIATDELPQRVQHGKATNQVKSSPPPPELVRSSKNTDPTVRANSGPLDLRVRPNEISFERPILAGSPVEAFSAREPALRISVQDNSVMGKFSRLTRRMDCAELRQALASNPSSAEVIIRTMEQRNCAH